MVNQAKLRSYCTSPCYKYSYEVPQDYNHATKLDKCNGNTKWQDSTALQMSQLHEYKTFKDLGKGGKGFHKICVHLVFDVKHNGCHKGRPVADGHLTEVLLDSVYSGVVSLHGICLLVFLAKLNDLDIWGTDIGIAYLEAENQKRSTLLQALNLVRWKDTTPSSSSRHSMASELLAYIGMSALLTVSGIWDSTHARLNLIFGCGKMATSKSTLEFI